MSWSFKLLYLTSLYDIEHKFSQISVYLTLKYVLKYDFLQHNFTCFTVKESNGHYFLCQINIDYYYLLEIKENIVSAVLESAEQYISVIACYTFSK